MVIYGILFYFFAFLCVVSASIVIFTRNPVNAVLWLIACFFSSAGIFMLMGAEFVSMIMIIVYVGAVAILFLFVVMMLNINFIKLKEGLNDYLGICLLIAVVLFVDFYLIYLDAIESPALDLIQPEWPSRISNKVPNTQQLGSILYTDFALPFQIAGIILLVAMVGSIVLTLRTRPNVKKQNIRMQLARKRSESVSLVDVEIGKGIK